MFVNDNEQLAYTIQEQEGRYEVCAMSGRVIMVCADEASADHYAALLNEAFRAGYKMGYRVGRKSR